MPRRLISTDLDGTIVFNGSIPLRDREAMARWRAAGNLLVINTGRSVSALEHVVVPMGLEFDNAILYTGAAVVDENIRVRRSTVLPPGVVEDILDFVEGAPGVTVFTTGLDEDLLIYDTIGSGSELLTLFRPATRRELDGREVIGVPMRSAVHGATSSPAEPPTGASPAAASPAIPVPDAPSPVLPSVSPAGGSTRLATSRLRPSPLEAEAGTTSMKSWLRKPTACPSQRRRR